MTFYLKPPRGCLELDKIIECVHQRMELIKSVTEDRPHPKDLNLSYFVEETAIDRASHFLLRLITSASPTLKHFVSQGEWKLFVNRLKFFNANQVISLLAISIRHIDEMLENRLNLDLSYKKFLDTTRKIFSKLLSKDAQLDHAFNLNHANTCRHYCAIVPFQFCLPMIANRKVDLKGGYAWVHCGNWSDLMACFFQMQLKFGYEDLVRTESNLLLQDSRIQLLSSLIESNFSKHQIKSSISSSQESGDFLTCANIDQRKKMFPPCMQSLLDELRVHHRLGHHARIQLTLFLKEAGMPVKEAIQFWRHIYSLPSCNQKCTHSWQKNERKYLYSIRHLYGLEGCRTNYAAPSCSTIQSSLLAPGVSGGCPLARMPEENLHVLLQKSYPFDLQDLPLTDSKSPTVTCNKLLSKLINHSDGQQICKPSHFYFVCKDWLSEF